MKKLDLENLNENNWDLILKSLKDGNVISYPTDTVYALSCDSQSDEAIEKIYKIKRRPLNKPLAIFVSNIVRARRVGFFPENIPDDLMDSFRNGKTTFILKVKEEVMQNKLLSPLLYEQNSKVGIRIPNHEFCQELLRRFGRPLVATSANPSGKPASTNYQDVEEYFADSKDLDVLICGKEGGYSSSKEPSKIVDLSGEEIVKVR